jgi:adenosylhomocysteine nucleosidase
VKVVAIISANAEWAQVRALLPGLEIERSPFGELAVTTVEGRQIMLFHGGWGKISAAATAQYVVDTLRPDLLVNLGTCGGFAGRVEVGTILLVERTVVYDILEQMGDGAAAIEHYSTLLDVDWLPRPLPHPATRGMLVSADRDLVAQDIPMLIEKYGAAAADWESGAIAWVAKRNKVACLILRGVSDLVGSEGGEAYGKLEVFHARTRVIMKELLAQLPDWLAAAEQGLAAREQAGGKGQSG